ncbi:MAG: S-layer homology domain-containing protein [Chloroflexota bacterium]
MPSPTDRRRRFGQWAVMLLALVAIIAIAASGRFGPQAGGQAGKAGGPESANGAAAVNNQPVAAQKVDAQQFGQVTQVRSAHNDTSLPLREMVPAAPQARTEQDENENPDPVGYGPDLPGKDSVVQRFFGPLAMPTPIINIAGINSVGGACNCAPPDTQGDVGPNNYVQMVNNAFQIWDKSGNSLFGPAQNNTLWAGFGGPCQTFNDGDPIVLHDQLADRWMLTQFVSHAPYGQCIAISATADPTGAYHRYYFPMAHANQLHDYPKFGIWPDGYYMTANRFFPDQSFAGPAVVVFDRAAMLQGSAATLQEIDPPNYFSTLLPSDLDGSTLPPAGAPNYLASTSAVRDSMRIWKFHVDWTTPANSSLTGPTNIPVAQFDPNMCGGSRNCIPQPNVTQKLDALAGRLMFRLAYRNMGDHEVLVGTSTVDEDGNDHAGVRWYEVRDPGGAPFVYQQGTYAPDSDHRWLPSIAMDHDGNIAVGYSVSSSTVFPSIRYSGRLATDPLGTLGQGETTLVAGTGSQSAPSRWGDYASMSVDPSDDCTFWYTNEYEVITAGYTWATRIGSFKFPGCGSGGATPTPTRTGTPPTATSTAVATSTPTAVPSVCANYAVATGTATVVGGTTLLTGSNCDDCTTYMTLPFGVKLYGTTFTNAYISSNGNLEFGSSDSAYGNDCLPVVVFDHSIMAYWDDLNTAGTDLGIFTQVTGTAPNRALHIEWRAQTFSSPNTDVVNFEIVLHEGSNNFEIVYGTVYQGGDDTTIGVQRDERYYTQVSCNTASVAAGTQLSFTIGDCPVPTSTPTTPPVTATATATACTITFSDVPEGSTFYPFIRCLACRGIINGYPDGTFKPNNSVTRGQLAKIVSNSAGFSDPAGTQIFEDVLPGSTFYDFVQRLASRNIMTGYPCGGAGEPCGSGNLPYFRPNANASRGQISKIVSNSAGFTDPAGAQAFEDVLPGSTFYDFIQRLAARTIMSGYPCGSPGEPCGTGNLPYFRPNANATRGQTAKIVGNTFYPNCQTPTR